MISVVARSEALVGSDDPASLQKAEKFLDFFPLLDVTKPIADLAASLRREPPLETPRRLPGRPRPPPQPPARDPEHEGLSARNARIRRGSI